MPPYPTGTLEWELPALVLALKIPEEEVIEYFKDGRRIAFLIERRLAREILGGALSPSEGSHFDAVDHYGNKWEIRSLSKRGTYFCPSYMVGSGREFDEAGFQEKLDSITGYIICDIDRFPAVPYWMVPKSEIVAWRAAGHLSKDTRISHKKFLELVEQNQ